MRFSGKLARQAAYVYTYNHNTQGRVWTHAIAIRCAHCVAQFIVIMRPRIEERKGHTRKKNYYICIACRLTVGLSYGRSSVGLLPSQRMSPSCRRGLNNRTPYLNEKKIFAVCGGRGARIINAPCTVIYSARPGRYCFEDCLIKAQVGRTIGISRVSVAIVIALDFW